MTKLFSSISVRKPKRNKFNLSHEKKLTTQMGKLVPIFLQEVVPGDSFRVKSEILVRMQALIAPIMHRIDITTHYFFVPNRLVWDNWEDFITGGEAGTSVPEAPYYDMSDALRAFFDESTLSDYFGIPTMPGVGAVLSSNKISAIPFRGYALIYDEYYRDQNVQAKLDPLKTDGDSFADTNSLIIRTRAWEKDYFTSALPFAQRGPEVLMPIDADADVTYLQTSTWRRSDTGGNPDAGASNFGSVANMRDVNNHSTRVENIDTISVTSSGVSINDLRRSIKLQEWLEKNARAGGRYTEQIMVHFGEQSPDARLQRPEFLGGGKNPMIISEVLQSAPFQDSDTEEDIPTATMAGHGISFGRTNGFTRKFVEHGYIFGIMSVMPRTGYQQGIPRHFSRFDRFDYFWTEFANIGEQEVKNKEIYTNALIASGTLLPEGTFGYQSRYAEYKYTPSTTHGTMRSSQAFWHMNRIFSSKPSLNTSFIISDPTSRIFADVNIGFASSLLVQVYNKVDAIRPMPYFGTPSL